MNFVFSSTVHGLQGRVDSLEKSNSKLIEEVRQSPKNENMDHSFLDIISIYILKISTEILKMHISAVISTENHHQPVNLYVNIVVFLYVKVIVYNLNVLNITKAFLRNTPECLKQIDNISLSP